MQKKIIDGLILVAIIAVAVWSGIHPVSRFEWAVEIILMTIGIIPFLATYHRFSFTSLAYLVGAWLLFVLLIGSHYTYLQMPISRWFVSYFHLHRDYYDRFVHFFQGFVPFFLLREVLIRKGVVTKKGWATFLSIGFALGLSALFELGEWSGTLVSGYDLLATQGDMYDTQKDMLMALCGAIACWLLLSRLQDHLLSKRTE